MLHVSPGGDGLVCGSKDAIEQNGYMRYWDRGSLSTTVESTLLVITQTKPGEKETSRRPSSRNVVHRRLADRC